MKIEMVRKRSNVPHSTRPEVRGACHVVLRVRRGLPWLRTPRTYRVLEGAFRAGKEKPGFALVQYSVQQDHLHLLVEAQSKTELARGIQGLMIRIAKRLNRYWRRRTGAVFAERYFSRAVEGYRAIKNALTYVINNARKHGSWSSSRQPDPFSSGRWFLGWLGNDICRPLRASPVVRPEAVRDMYLALANFRHFSLDHVPGQHASPSMTLEQMLQA